MSIGLYYKATNKPVKIGDTITLIKSGNQVIVRERLSPSFRYGAAAIVDDSGAIRVPSEYGAYATTE